MRKNKVQLRTGDCVKKKVFDHTMQMLRHLMEYDYDAFLGLVTCCNGDDCAKFGFIMAERMQFMLLCSSSGIVYGDVRKVVLAATTCSGSGANIVDPLMAA